MPELDHLIFASADLGAGIAHIEGLTGATAVPGGPHPGLGTHNALLTFDDTTYFEIIAIDPDQPDPSGPRPFGLDDGAGPRLAGYAIHPAPGETIEEAIRLLREAGHDPGSVAAMSRVKPDGQELHWRLTRAPGGDVPTPVPFVIDWGETPSPARSLPSMGALRELRVSHPDPAKRRVVEALGLGLVAEDGPTGLAATVETPNGTVVIS